MHLRSLIWKVALSLAFQMPIVAEAAPLEPWYPFLSGSKWGFIDSSGAWKIQPAYDYACDIFNQDLVRVTVAGKFGYIDRQGQWVAKPEFDFVSPYFEYGTLQAVSRNKKFGILSRQGRLVVPLLYDDVVLSNDRAWVRKGNHLGIMGLDGKWIHPPDIPWPSFRTTPQSLNPDNVAWFQEHPDADGKWGLINSQGKIVFSARFRPRRPDVPERVWPEPPDMQFVNGHAWVFEDGGFESISARGDVGIKMPFRTIVHWAGDLSLFTEKEAYLFGLVSSTGEIVLPANACEIKKPVDGLARYFWRGWAYSGFLDMTGHPVVAAGQFGFPQDPSEGLIAASRQATRSAGSNVYDPRGVFLNLAGKEVPLTSDNYFAVGSFSDGLAAMQDLVETGRGCTPEGGKWGFVDRTGAAKIAPQFGSASRFCRGRAWVSLEVHSSTNPIAADYALIDASGKLLTDYHFMPPDLDRPGIEIETAILPDVRWRGDLVVLDGGWQVGFGLAKADGTVLAPPQFNFLGPLADGMIQTITLKGEDRWTGYVNAPGQVVIPAIYTGGTDFEEGSAWVTKQPNDHRVHAENSGWFLIGHQGQVLSSESYLSPCFINEEHYKDLGGLTDVPQFMGDLACVASSKTYIQYGDDRLRHLDWGYIGHAGKVVAWHAAEPK